MKENQSDRDSSGNTVKPTPMTGTYGDQRMEKLKDWRKGFNVDDHGFYKGGGKFRFN